MIPVRRLSLNPEYRPAAAVAFVALMALLVYAHSLANGFAYDDEFIILLRGEVHGLGRLRELLTTDYWPPEFTSSLYRPVTLLSFAIDWAIWSGKPFGFHLTNILIHSAVAAVLTLLLFRFFPWWAAMAGGLVFAVHSVHTEAVTNVVGRAELLAALFAIAACLVYTGAVRRGHFSISTIALIAVCYALAALSKEVGIVVPALLLVTDLPFVPSGRAGSLKQYVSARLPLWATLTAVLVLILGLRLAMLGAAVESLPGRAFIPDASFPTRLFTMARVWPKYFELLLFPFDLSADYSPAVLLPARQLTAQGVVGFVLVFSAIVLAVAAYRRAPEFGMAVGWAGVALIPVSNLVITAQFLLAERTFYLPSAAVSIVAALVVTRTSSRRQLALGLGVLLWLVAFSVVTIRRNPVWQSTDTVFEDLRRRHPESSRLLWGVASQYRRKGDWQQARAWYRKSLQVWPYHPPYLAEYAHLLLKHGEMEAADSLAARAVELNPRSRTYHRLLTLIRLRRGDEEGALEAIDRGVAAVGDDPVLYRLQADTYADLGDFQRAVQAQEVAVRTRAEGPEWNGLLRLALFSAAAGDTAAALTALAEARQVAGAQPLVADSLEQALRGLR